MCWSCRTEEREEGKCVGGVCLRTEGKRKVFEVSV